MKLKLGEHERNEELWLKIKEGIKEELDVLRRKNDAMLTPELTSALRGRIAALKDLLLIEDVNPVE